MAKTLFQKGRSGNPSGRPRLPKELIERAKAMSPEMLQTLYELAKDKSQSGSVRVSAAEAVINRGHGKPTVTVETRRRDFADLTDRELQDIIEGRARTGQAFDDGPSRDDQVH